MAESEKPKSVLGYIFSLLGGAAIAAMVTGAFNLKLETRKFESSLIQSAISQETVEKRIEALEFILEMKLVRDDVIVAGLREAIVQKQVPQVTPPSPPQVLIQPEQQSVLNWAVLFGGYKTLEEAEQQRQKTLGYGLVAPTIYKNGSLFELALPASSRSDASKLMESLLSFKLSKSPLVIELSRWCPNPVSREGYLEGDPNENQYIQRDHAR